MSSDSKLTDKCGIFSPEDIREVVQIDICNQIAADNKEIALVRRTVVGKSL